MMTTVGIPGPSFKGAARNRAASPGKTQPVTVPGASRKQDSVRFGAFRFRKPVVGPDGVSETRVKDQRQIAPYIEQFLAANGEIKIKEMVHQFPVPKGQSVPTTKRYELGKSAPDAFDIRFEEEPQLMRYAPENGPREWGKPPRGARGGVWFKHELPSHFLYPLAQGHAVMTAKDEANPIRRIDYRKDGKRHTVSVEIRDEQGEARRLTLEHTARIRKTFHKAITPVGYVLGWDTYPVDARDTALVIHKLNRYLALHILLQRQG